jgi:hypothetical protein
MEAVLNAVQTVSPDKKTKPKLLSRLAEKAAALNYPPEFVEQLRAESSDSEDGEDGDAAMGGPAVGTLSLPRGGFKFTMGKRPDWL